MTGLAMEQRWVSGSRNDCSSRRFWCHTGPGRPTSGMTTASPIKSSRLKDEPPSQVRIATTSSTQDGASPQDQRVLPEYAPIQPFRHQDIMPDANRAIRTGLPAHKATRNRWDRDSPVLLNRGSKGNDSQPNGRQPGTHRARDWNRAL